MNKFLLFVLPIVLLLSASLNADSPLQFCQTEDPDAYPTTEYHLKTGHECLVEEASGRHSTCTSQSPNVSVVPHQKKHGRWYPVLRAHETQTGMANGMCIKVPDNGAGSLRRYWRVNVIEE